MIQRIRRALPWAAAALVACGGGGGPAGPSGIDVRGTYQGSHVIVVGGGGTTAEFECPATVTITRSSRGTIQGTVAIGDCPALELTATSIPFTGTVEEDGSIEVRIAGLTAVLQQEGCTVDRIDPGFAGQVVLATGRLDAVFSAQLTCTGSPTPIVITWSIETTRAP